MADDARCMSLIKESEGLLVDMSRQRVTPKTMDVRAWGLACLALACPRSHSHACVSHTLTHTHTSAHTHAHTGSDEARGCRQA
jgi:hypothetical protein